MVIPTIFERLLQEVAQQAGRDAQGAFARLDELYGKSQSEQEIQQLAALSVHLGGAGLGRWDETAQFQRRLMEHTAVQPNGNVARSLWRGLSVVLHCAGNKEEAQRAAEQGVTTPAERCRLAIMTAQTLAARGRINEVKPLLADAATLCAQLPANDEVVTQTALVCTGLGRLFEAQIRQAQEMLIAVNQTATVASRRSSDWRNLHKALYQEGRAHLLAADPSRALELVQEMMALEDANGAGPAERFYTASLACRAQIVRGQRKVAAAALEACRDFAGRVNGEQTKFIQVALDELLKFNGSRTSESRATA